MSFARVNSRFSFRNADTCAPSSSTVPDCPARAAPPDVTGDAAFTQLYSVTSFTFTFGANRRHASRDSFGSIDSNTNLTD